MGKTSTNKVVNEEENEEQDLSLSGPGYMGWEINDELEKKSDDTDIKKTVVELMECYAVIKKEATILLSKLDIQGEGK